MDGGSNCGLILGVILATAWRESGNHEKYIRIACILAKIQDTRNVLLLEQTSLGFHCKAHKILEMYIIMQKRKQIEGISNNGKGHTLTLYQMKDDHWFIST
jgi:hypothetical protein